MIPIPRYDYRCDTCQETFEIEHPMAETMDYHPCRDVECEGVLHKTFHPTPGIFRGGGWGKVYGVHKPKTIT